MTPPPTFLTLRRRKGASKVRSGETRPKGTQGRQHALGVLEPKKWFRSWISEATPRFVSFWETFVCPYGRAEYILRPIRRGVILNFFVFDKVYVDRLRDGEPSTEQHFVTYFGEILGIMLRARYLP